MPRPLPPSRLALGLTAAALLAPAPAAFAADPVNQAGWSATTQELSSGINLGYETAIDPVHRRLYAADAQPTTRERRPVRDADGNPTGETTYETTVPASGKIVSFDTATNAFLKNWSHLNLLGSDGILGGGFSRLEHAQRDDRDLDLEQPRQLQPALRGRDRPLDGRRRGRPRPHDRHRPDAHEQRRDLPLLGLRADRRRRPAGRRDRVLPRAHARRGQHPPQGVRRELQLGERQLSR